MSSGRIRTISLRRQGGMIERASRRFSRRRQTWLAATDGERDFHRAIAHPTWALVEEANRLLLRLGDRP